MKLHIITVGSPKLEYAKLGWEEYLGRLKHYHQVRVTHIADKHNNAAHFLDAMQGSFSLALTIDGPQYSSHQLATFLEKRAVAAQELSLLIGGPDGLPIEVIAMANQQLGLSKLTFPHDLAMLMLVETLYRASTINNAVPYHR